MHPCTLTYLLEGASILEGLHSDCNFDLTPRNFTEQVISTLGTIHRNQRKEYLLIKILDNVLKLECEKLIENYGVQSFEKLKKYIITDCFDPELEKKEAKVKSMDDEFKTLHYSRQLINEIQKNDIDLQQMIFK